MNNKPKRLILGFIPNNQCNLKCEYCYITQMERWGKNSSDFIYPPEHIVKALSAKRLGGKSLINLTGQGETLLYSGIVELTKGLLMEGHFVELVTNALSTKVINTLLEIPDQFLSHLEFKISFHYKELQRKNLLTHFFRNVQSIKASAASFSLELMPYDEIETCIDEINRICIEKVGAKCHATIGRKDSAAGRGLLTEHSKENFANIWAPLDSEMFRYKMELIDVKRKEFCYAGSWTLYVDLSTGDARQCYGQPINQNIFRDISKPILFIPVGFYCVQPYCINGHAFLTLGAIPSLKSPTYEQMRNRKCLDDSEWLSESFKRCFSSRLRESNNQYNSFQKLLHTVSTPFMFIYWALKNWGQTKTMLHTFLKRFLNK